MNNASPGQNDVYWLLTSFLDYFHRLEKANLERIFNTHIDSAHIFSSKPFLNGIIGLAYLSSICSSLSGSVLSVQSPIVGAMGHLAAHEMGHNLGLNHEDGSGFIMSPFIDYFNFATTFSTRSYSELQSYMNKSVGHLSFGAQGLCLKICL